MKTKCFIWGKPKDNESIKVICGYKRMVVIAVGFFFNIQILIFFIIRFLCIARVLPLMLTIWLLQPQASSLLTTSPKIRSKKESFPGYILFFYQKGPFFPEAPNRLLPGPIRKNVIMYASVNQCLEKGNGITTIDSVLSSLILWHQHWHLELVYPEHLSLKT